MNKPTHASQAATILVVDDNPSVLTLLASLFKEQGMAVVLAQSVAEAKQALADADWNFDLVLTDISMPGETGFDLLSWIKRPESPRPELPVLLTTAQLPEAENRLKGLAMGAVDYVVRPIELGELVLRSMNAIEHFRRVRSLETSLQDSENLAMFGRLLAASHHEIKNLATLVHLTAEQTVARFAPMVGSPTSMEAQLLERLGQASNLLADVALSVQTLLTPGSIQLSVIDIRSVAHDVARLMRAQIRPCRLEISAEAGQEGAPVWVTGHSARLKQVLINLILNSRDAIQELDSPEGGCIRLSLSAEAGFGCLTVRDNGIGLSAPGIKTEFRAFETTKKLRGGQGLGLWLCARLMANMQGSLSLASEGVGRGAEAVVRLPLAQAPQKPDALDAEVARYLAEMEAAGC